MRSMAEADYVYETPVPRAAAACPVEDWLAFLGHRWNASLLWHLSASPKRFGELADRLVGVTAKVLTERLAGLEARGLVVRAPQATFPRSVVYRLTAKGEALMAVIDKLEPWSRKQDWH